ncbi:hypothetical protein EVC28_074 [Rhizobium phage RHph_I1_23]|nr:hypothetical protein EVC28_074 [Rhizobium phage RHph_I1_23]
MSNILSFPAKKEGDPLDDATMCTITINGRGDIELMLNVDAVETVEQHNWLIAKIVDASSRLIDRKNAIIDAT